MKREPTWIPWTAAFLGTMILAAGCDQHEEGQDHKHVEKGKDKEGGPPRNEGAPPRNEGAAEAKAAHAEIKDKDGKVLGHVTFTEHEGGIKVEATVDGMAPGKHGFHIHEAGDCSAADFTTAKGHFNPDGKKHGGPDSAEHHAGDLGNIEVGPDGTGRLEIEMKGLTVAAGDHSVAGKGLILHEKEDDLTTDPTGNAGARLGCGEIQEKR